MDDKLKLDAGTITRTIVLLLTMVNAVLALLGKDKIPFTENGIYEAVTVITTLGATIWAWWKNNAFTHNARKAEKYRKDLSKEEKTGKEDNNNA